MRLESTHQVSKSGGGQGAWIIPQKREKEQETKTFEIIVAKINGWIVVAKKCVTPPFLRIRRKTNHSLGSLWALRKLSENLG